MSVARTLEELLTELRGKVTRLERRLNRVGAGGGGGGGSDYVLPGRLGGPTGNIPDLGPGIDLNTIKAPGWYIQNANVDATLALNYPIARAGYLEVNAGDQGAGNDFTFQTYTEYAPASTGKPLRQWNRTQYGTTWYPWVQIDPGAANTTVLPAPIRYQETGVATVAATAWGTVLPGFTPPSMTVDKPLWVLVTIGMWLQASAGDTRAGLALAGATIMAPPSLPQDGGSSSTWGQVAQAGSTDFTAAGGSGQRSIQRLVKINPGTTTFRLEAYMASAGTHQVNYAVMEVIPLYFEGAAATVIPVNGTVTRRSIVTTTPYPASSADLAIPWDQNLVDSGHFTTAGGVITCVIPGTYRITQSVGASQGTTVSGWIRGRLWINGVLSAEVLADRDNVGGRAYNLTYTVALNAGDQITSTTASRYTEGSLDANSTRTFIELVPVTVDVATGGPKIATGTAVMSAGSIATATGVDIPVVFPAGMFTAPPDGLFAIASNGRVTISHSAASLTKDGVTFRADNWSTGAVPGNNTIRWTAIQT